MFHGKLDRNKLADLIQRILQDGRDDVEITVKLHKKASVKNKSSDPKKQK